MTRKKRLPKAGERVKIGRRLLTVPGVRSMTDPGPTHPGPTDPGPIAPAAKSGGGEPERPTEELSEELARTVKAAYQ